MGLNKQVAQSSQASKVVLILVLLLVVIAAGLRFWKLEYAAQFLGDQGRDALIVADIFRKHDIVAIGPTTSVGNIYLGPLYYYFMLPFLYLTYPNPIGPVYAVAVIGTLTVFFLYYWGRKMVGTSAAIFAAILCTFSVVAINLSRFSWNPNPTPLVMLGLVYASYRALTKHAKYWLGVGIAFAILLQLHYVTLLAGAAAGLLWLWQLGTAIIKHKPWKELVGYGLGAVMIVLVSLAPLVLFDLKHGALNAKALQGMFTTSGNFTTNRDSTPRTGWDVVRETHGRGMHILLEFQIGNNRQLNSWIVAIVSLAALAYVLRRKSSHHTGFTVIVVYLVVGIIGFSFYRNTVFDHYIAFLFPCTFLLFGYYLGKFWDWNSVGRILATAAVLFFLTYNVPRYSFEPSSANFALLSEVATSIHQRVPTGVPYGVVLRSVTKDYQAMNYRYFLSTTLGKEPLPSAEHGWAELLFIIDEEKLTLPPEELDVFEVNSFNNPQVQERYTIPNGPDITVLKKGS